MRLWIARAVLLVGAAALVAAVLSLTWGRAHAERIPLNVDTYTYLTGTASGLRADNSTTPVPVKYLNLTQADASHSDGKVVALQQTTCINIDQNNPPDCLGPDSSGQWDPRTVELSVESFALDRHTAQAVSDQSSHIPGSTTPYAGIIDKFPFHVKQQDYPYWMDTIDKTFTAHYVGEKTIDGLKTYQFDVTVPATSGVVFAKGVDGQPDTTGTYGATQSIWVDPTTGAFIDQKGTQTLTLPDGTNVLSIDVAYTDATVKANVDTAKSNGRMLTLVEKVIPIVGFVLAVLLLGLGIFLGRGKAVIEPVKRTLQRA